MLRLAVVLLLCSLSVTAQKALNREVSIHAVKQPLREVLADMEKQGHFYFSYSSGLIAPDSLVSLQVSGEKVSEVLKILFKDAFQYKVVNEYIIIQKAPPEKYLFLEGVLLDCENEEAVDNASVYSRSHLVSALSDDQGHFKLRIKEKLLPVSVTVSKLGYRDTTFTYTGSEEKKKICLSRKVFALEEDVMAYSKKRGRFKMSFLIPKSQLIHSRNLGNFFTSLPYQMSFTPGASTQGKLSSQVVNKVSINMIGGYTGGVNGAEIGGLFNINRKSVRYFQAAGIFNTVFGSVRGVQAGGIYNTVADSVNGLQVGGLFNRVGAFTSGIQTAGICNFAENNLRGVQVAGGFNRVRDTLSGVQAGIVNSAGHLAGLQVGLINFAESSDGVSIGLLNFIKDGRFDIQVYTTEVFSVALAVKTGTRRFYTSLIFAGDFMNNPAHYSLGLYLGTEMHLHRRWFTKLEAGQSLIVADKWENSASFLRFQPELHYRVSPRLSVFAGPSLSAYRKPSEDTNTYDALPYFQSRVKMLNRGGNWALWAGFQAGIAFRMKK